MQSANGEQCRRRTPLSFQFEPQWKRRRSARATGERRGHTCRAPRAAHRVCVRANSSLLLRVAAHRLALAAALERGTRLEVCRLRLRLTLTSRAELSRRSEGPLNQRFRDDAALCLHTGLGACGGGAPIAAVCASGSAGSSARAAHPLRLAVDASWRCSRSFTIMQSRKSAAGRVHDALSFSSLLSNAAAKSIRRLRLGRTQCFWLRQWLWHWRQLNAREIECGERVDVNRTRASNLNTRLCGCELCAHVVARGLKRGRRRVGFKWLVGDERLGLEAFKAFALSSCSSLRLDLRSRFWFEFSGERAAPTKGLWAGWRVARATRWTCRRWTRPQVR